MFIGVGFLSSFTAALYIFKDVFIWLFVLFNSLGWRVGGCKVWESHLRALLELVVVLFYAFRVKRPLKPLLSRSQEQKKAKRKIKTIEESFTLFYKNCKQEGSIHRIHAWLISACSEFILTKSLLHTSIHWMNTLFNGTYSEWKYFCLLFSRDAMKPWKAEFCWTSMRPWRNRVTHTEVHDTGIKENTVQLDDRIMLDKGDTKIIINGRERW